MVAIHSIQCSRNVPGDFMNHDARDFVQILVSFVCNHLCSPVVRRVNEKERFYDTSSATVIETDYLRSERADMPGHSLIM